MTEEIKKRKGRGVSNNTVATAQLKFHEDNAAANKLFIGHLEDVTVNWATAGEKSAFAGHKIPYLTFAFESNENDKSIRKHVYETLFPQPSNIATIPGGDDAWRVDNIMKWIKHIFDVFGKGRRLTEVEEDALTLPFVDFDEETNEWISVEIEDVINGYAFIFSNIAAILNGTFGLKEGDTPKPMYKTADGKGIPIWMKLLRAKKTKKGWTNVTQNGDLGFDDFLGTGAIELMNGTNPPLKLKVDIAKESITPKESPKPMIGGFAQMPGAVPVMPNTMGAPMVGSEAAAFNAANGDTPF